MPSNGHADRKAGTAARLIASGGVVSVQALKANLEVVPAPLAVNERAVALASANDLNIYDAWIVAAALENDCDLVLSEDLRHGRAFLGLRIENPFRRR